MRPQSFSVPSGFAAALALLAMPGAAAAEAAVLASADAAVSRAERHDPHLKLLDAEAQRAEVARRAERVLPNPEAEASWKRSPGNEPGGSGSGQWEFAVKGDIGALLAAPWTFGAADARARAARGRAEDARAERRFVVEAAWYRSVAARALQTLEAEAASTREAEAELARRRRGAGTLNALDLAEAEAAAAQGRIAARRAAREAEEARADLTALTEAADGTDAGDAPDLPAALPEPPGNDPTAAQWLAAARAASPALDAERAEIDAARRELSRARLASLPGLRAGVALEGGDGPLRAGPVAALEVPLFDLGFGRRAQARAEVAVAERRAEAVEQGLAPRVLALHAALREARAAHAAWRDTVLPLREAAAAEALRHYNFMLVGADRLLAARREELAARRAATEALRDYWLARAALRRLAGGEVPATDGAEIPAVSDPAEAATTTRPPAEENPQPSPHLHVH